MIRVSAFRWVPDFAQGLVRELRVRWALEEAGLAYTERLLGPEDQGSPEYRRLQPFGQVPSYEEDGLEMFESGAIVLHIAERSPALAPDDRVGRARVATWALAALNTIEPPIGVLAEIDLFYPGEAWAKARRPGAVEDVRKRLGELAGALGDRAYLEDRFTAGDLMMATVLRILRHTDLVTADPILGPYLTRCEARPAFKKALAAQMTTFEAHRPAA